MADEREVESLKQAVAALQWWHTIDLGNGIVTPGGDPTPARLPELQIPHDLTGLTVLDIGAWDGFFSFEAERRGARRVLATDSFCWGTVDGERNRLSSSRVTPSARASKTWTSIRSSCRRNESVPSISVFYFGVLYHMRHPLLALERVFSVTRRHLILQTQVDLTAIERPAIAFYPEQS